MTGPTDHPSDEIQLLVESRLEPDRRAPVEAHLAECARCRRELEALRSLRSALRDELTRHPAPPELEARITAALAAEAAPPRSATGTARPLLRRRPAAIGLTLAAAAVAVLLLGRGGGDRDLVNAAVRDFVRYRAGTLRIEMAASAPTELERRFAAAGVGFATRVFDFGMMGYRLRGGGVHRLAGRVSALFAYDGDSGQRVVCQMYPGDLAELPAPAEEREHNGIRFLVFRTDDLTLVFWQEGEVVCVLVSDAEPEVAIQLAYAKAIKV
jgi:anti-sigma factor RsiW